MEPEKKDINNEEEMSTEEIVEEINRTKEQSRCLKQLRTSKYELIWNRQFEILSLTTFDLQTLEKAELGGSSNLSQDQITSAKDNVNLQIRHKELEIQRASFEITLLDSIILDLENRYVELERKTSHS